MPYTALDLIELLALEPLELNIFRGSNRDIGTGRIFGGQVLAQALVAARRTVEDDRPAHSLHGYFMLAGDISAPVVYFVDRIRDGKSFTTRTVRAIQHGKAIFAMTVSFQRPEEGPSHQQVMPDVTPPEQLPSELDLLRAHADELNPELRRILTQDRPLDFRPRGRAGARSGAAPLRVDPGSGGNRRRSPAPPGRARVCLGLRAAGSRPPAARAQVPRSGPHAREPGSRGLVPPARVGWTTGSCT